MKKDKVEALKVLASEIIDLNQELPKGRSITFHIGCKGELLKVGFFYDREEGLDCVREFRIYLSEPSLSSQIRFKELKTMLKEWREYCNE